MSTSALNSRVPSVVAAYSIFGQLWPQFEEANDGERRMVGLELELIGSHASEASHLDPSCPMCQHVRSVLLDITALMSKHDVDENSVFYDMGPHWNPTVSSSGSENRSTVSVSIVVSWDCATGQAFETALQSKIRDFLERYGIHLHHPLVFDERVALSEQ
jgi:hypothetical protein